MDMLATDLADHLVRKGVSRIRLALGLTSKGPIP
jgi:hypothetical protein